MDSKTIFKKSKLLFESGRYTKAVELLLPLTSRENRDEKELAYRLIIESLVMAD